MPATEASMNLPASGGASFSLQRRLQPVPVALIGLFFKGAIKSEF
jgi:hypothetical protein